ncbi:MAG: PspC domain-containing protein [Propionibacteriaceae bacterium]|nr:PspC domain-containing protein [Propionibacteriaceae bacterium]
MKQASPFRRSATDTVVAGLCGALGQRLGINAGLIRLGLILLSFFTQGFVPVVYVILWLTIPRENDVTTPLRQRLSRRDGSLILAVLVVLAVVVSASTGSFAVAPLVACLVIGLVVTRLVRRRRSKGRSGAGRGPAGLDQALAAWQDRLAQVESSAQAPPAGGYALPSSLAEAARLNPESQGFLHPVPAPSRASADQAPLAEATLSTPVGPPDHATSSAAANPPARATLSEPVPTPAVGGAIEVANFLPSEGLLPEPDGAATTVLVRRRRPVLVGWVVVVLLAATQLGGLAALGDTFLFNPQLPVGSAAGVLGAALVASPWLGRPRWLVPVAGLFVAVVAGWLLLAYFFPQL